MSSWDRTQLMAMQDDCLIAIQDGRPLPWAALDNLPPWRAVLLADVAARAGIGIRHPAGVVVTANDLRALASKCGGGAGPGWLTAGTDKRRQT